MTWFLYGSRWPFQPILPNYRNTVSLPEGCFFYPGILLSIKRGLLYLGSFPPIICAKVHRPLVPGEYENDLRLWLGCCLAAIDSQKLKQFVQTEKGSFYAAR